MSSCFASRLVFLLAVAALPLVGCGDNIKPPEPTEPEQVVKVCEELPPLDSGVCSVTAGDDTKFLRGTVLTPGITYVGGKVAVDATGVITCVGCDCTAGAATQITCPQGVISPGLINPHDHITFAQNSPVKDTTGERFEHRHDWRTGLRGHTAVDVPGSAGADAIRFGELRFVFGGGTSTNGSGGQAGLLRNLDRMTLLEGLGQPPLHYQTFPLGDSNSTQRRVTCNYGASASSPPDTATSIAGDEAYTPHVSEGIDQAAHNEFLCTSSDSYDVASSQTDLGASNDLMLAQTAIIHGTGLLPADFALMALRNTALIWSPRTNISLYGDTAQVTAASRLGVQIALGTDWIATGSTNMLRELQCADQLNRDYYDHYFSDAALWRMATVNAAAAVAVDDAIGVLKEGNLADISIFDGRVNKDFRAIIDGEPKSVALVMRGGKALYGDEAIIAGLRPSGCDAVDVCGTAKQVCLMDEIGKTWTQLTAALPATRYPAFYCGAPADEPTCKPSRPVAVNGSTVYTGTKSATDQDGDGIGDSTDNCPAVFNPIRPLDNGKQGDADGDGKGDVCDVCPLTANATKCVAYDPKDRDADGKLDTADNCPLLGNANQTDSDGDGKGDACDDCPMAKNVGAAACPGTIYGVKNGTIPVDVQVEITNALVTGKGSNGFFVQVKETDAGYTSADYSGLFVFTTSVPFLAAAEVGGRVTLEGQLTNFFGQLEISNTTAVTRVGATVEAAPAATTATVAELRAGARAAKLEAVIVQTATSTVTAINTPQGEFTTTQAAMALVVDDFLFANPFAPGVDQSYATLGGILAFRNNAYKLEPRNQADLAAIARIASFGPGPAFIRNGQTGVATIPAPLAVRLTMPVTTDTVVTITSSDTAALTVDGGAVTIPAGQLSAPVLLTGVAPAAAVTLTATLSAQTFTATVRVLDAADAPATVVLTPATITMTPASSKTLTVTLDVPAPVGGSVVTLAVAPANAGTLPATVTVAQDQVAATFTYTDASTVSSATITATFLASTSTSAITVSAAASGLMINEVDYDSVGADTSEFIEIYNGTGAAVDLTNLAIVLINGGSTPASQYKRVLLGPANGGTLPVGGYLVIASATVTVMPGGILYTPPTADWAAQDNVQNGAPDGLLLFNVSTGEIVDRFSYEGAIINATIPAPPAAQTGVTLVEGTALGAGVADNNATIASLCRLPNGTDTNNAATDWNVTTQLTPGGPNAPTP